MSIQGIGSVGAAQAIAQARTAEAAASEAARPADAGPAAWFDMTSWRGAGEPAVTVGPAASQAALPALSASVLSAVLR